MSRSRGDPTVLVTNGISGSPLSPEQAGPNPAQIHGQLHPDCPAHLCLLHTLEKAGRGRLITGLSGDGSGRIMGESVQRAAIMWSILKYVYDVYDGASRAGNGHCKRLFCRQSLKECHRFLKLQKEAQIKGIYTFSSSNYSMPSFLSAFRTPLDPRDFEELSTVEWALEILGWL